MEPDVRENNGSGTTTMKEILAGEGFDLPRVGQILSGEIIGISKGSVLIDLGSLGTGIVYPSEFYDNQSLQKELKLGQKVSAVLMDIENEEGYRELSLRKAQKTTAWQDIKNRKESGEVIETKIQNINKGGLIVEINGIQGFLPLSQLAPEHYPKVEGGDTTKIVQALQKLRNQEIKIKIIDFSEAENKLIVSERAIMENQLREEISKLRVGDIVEVEITDVTDFGAFAAIPLPSEETLLKPPEKTEEAKEKAEERDAGTDQGAEKASETKSLRTLEGLIHISEIDWKLIDDPRDFLQKGQKVKTKIVSIDGNRIALSLKALKPDPWESAEKKFAVGQTVAGKVAKITNSGVLISLDDEITGFIPLSELGEKRPAEIFNPGDEVRAVIVSLEPKEHRMTLTLEEKKAE